MTLLGRENLENTVAAIPRLDGLSRELSGLSLYELCCRAMDVEPVASEARGDYTVACVPITSGNGLIDGFCPLVGEILERLAGVRSFVTSRSDVAGFQEAVASGADIVFMADDDAFVAYNVRTGAAADNGVATGRAFAALLDAARADDDGEVLVLGMGPVGTAAWDYLAERGIRAFWHDIEDGVSGNADLELRVPDWEERAWPYIVDATTAAKLIRSRNVTQDTVIAAPGVPLGVSPGAIQKAQLVINEELAIGVVAMLCEATRGDSRASSAAAPSDAPMPAERPRHE